MSIGTHLQAVIREQQVRFTRWLLGHRIRARHPSLRCDPTAIWDYGFHDLDAIEIGQNVVVHPFAEIVVYRDSPRSRIQGKLILEEGAVVGSGAMIRAAGGTIRIGKNSGIAQNTAAIAANHLLRPGTAYLRTAWDEERTGVMVGNNVWVGANCVLLPGCRIGDDAVIAAGSVVRGEVPSGELWGGVPARRIRALASAELESRQTGPPSE